MWNEGSKAGEEGKRESEGREKHGREKEGRAGEERKGNFYKAPTKILKFNFHSLLTESSIILSLYAYQ